MHHLSCIYSVPSAEEHPQGLERIHQYEDLVVSSGLVVNAMEAEPATCSINGASFESLHVAGGVPNAKGHR